MMWSWGNDLRSRIGASAADHPDAALLAAAADLRALLARYAPLEAEAHRTYALVTADPEWPLAFRDDGFDREGHERIYARHGYGAANDAWSNATVEARHAVERLAQTQAQTIGGAAAKAAVLQATVKWDQVITDEHDIVERVIAPIVADLQWLCARKA